MSFVDASAENRACHADDEHGAIGDLSGFLSDLTRISRAYGIAISGSPELIEMENDDYAFSYRCGADGRLVRE